VRSRYPEPPAQCRQRADRRPAPPSAAREGLREPRGHLRTGCVIVSLDISTRYIGVANSRKLRRRHTGNS
jgi:hypothetical protein